MTELLSSNRQLSSRPHPMLALEGSMRNLLFALLCAAALGADAVAGQQAEAPPADAPRVFLDCPFYCDQDFIRTEINWVNWVRDRADAQVHILVTRQSTAGGGAEWVLNFIGLRDLQGKADTLKYVSAQSDTEDLIRQGMVRYLKVGLAPHLLNTSLAPRLQITMGTAPANTPGTQAVTGPATDPWDFWVFSVSARTNFNGESSQSSTNYNGNVSANRTTENWKLRAGVYGSYNEDKFTYAVDARDTTVISIRKNYSLDLLAVKSFGAHWAAGVQSGASSATFGNIALGLSGGPAIEFSYWPYSEATRRSLTFRYSAGVRSFDYRELTIFNKTKETHPSHSFTSALDLRQRWGSMNFQFNFSQYLHKMSFYNASMFGNANLKLFKGFSLDFYGEYARVRDQLSLALEDPTEGEVLLRQQQLATSYRYWGGIGIRYSFGSIFNNVVNPRFGGGGGIMIMN